MGKCVKHNCVIDVRMIQQQEHRWRFGGIGGTFVLQSNKGTGKTWDINNNNIISSPTISAGISFK